MVSQVLKYSAGKLYGALQCFNALSGA